MYCAKCGAKNREDARFCHACRQPLRPLDATPKHSATPSAAGRPTLSALQSPSNSPLASVSPQFIDAAANTQRPVHSTGTQRCPQCGTENGLEAQFCHDCRQVLTSGPGGYSGADVPFGSPPFAVPGRRGDVTPVEPTRAPSYAQAGERGLLWAYAGGVIAALVAGYIGYQINSQIGFLIILGPAIMGAVAALAFIRLAGRTWRSSRTTPFPFRKIALTSAALGVLAYASMFVYEYREVVAQLEAEGYTNITERISFTTYLALKAEAGTSVGSVRRPNMNGSISGGIVYLLWLLEAAAGAFGGYWVYRKTIEATLSP